MLARFSDVAQGDGANPADERRRAERVSTLAHVSVRSMRGDSAAAVVRDVSPFGCYLECDAPWRRAGMILSLELREGDRIDAVVRWIDDEACGLEFLRQVANAEARFGGA